MATLIARKGVGTPKAIGAGSGTAIAAQSLTHMEAGSRIGAPGDKVMTPPLMKFLGRCLR